MEKEKINLKIIMPVIILAAVLIFAIVLMGENESKEFKEVAHICNNLGGLPGMQITSPEIIDVWYFEEDDHSFKEVVVCFTGENTSSNYYQYFMWQDGREKDYVTVAYAKDEVHSSNIIMKNSSVSNETILNCAALMLYTMDNGKKIESSQINKINKLISSGKIDKYKDYKISE